MNPTLAPQADVEAWLLSGGEGRRMGGRDKGLMPWRGEPLALHTARRLAPQVAPQALHILANRHLPDYRSWGWPVVPDDPALPVQQGPLIGMLTALRTPGREWLQFAPCDSPELPLDLVRRLRQSAEETGARLIVPMTFEAPGGDLRHHWCTALVNRELVTSLAQAVEHGERRIRTWAQEQAWIGVCFGSSLNFANFNTPESLHESPSA